MFAEPEFWVAVAFVILMGVFAYVGVHKTVLKALDNRSARIKAELDDARRLKDEAAKVLADYKTRRASAEAEAKAKMEDFVARRTKTAESKIALAEAQAVADVRAAAADAAIAAASTILSQSGKGTVADDLLAKGIAEVRQKLN